MITQHLKTIPGSGYVFACFRDKIVFEQYEITDGRLISESMDIFEREDPKECHFFNAQEDLHIIYRESRGDTVSVLLTEDEEKNMEPDLLFTEEVLVRKEFSAKAGIPEKLRIVNRYRYSENDTLVLRNYRICY